MSWDPKKALHQLLTLHKSRHGFDKTIRWGEHAVATNGCALLVVHGRADLGEIDPPEISKDFEVIDPLRSLEPIAWPASEIPEHSPGEALDCDDCGGSGACHACGAPDRCETCEGSGAYDKPDPREPNGEEFVRFRLPSGDALVNIRALAVGLHVLPGVKWGLVDEVNGISTLFLGGHGWNYLLMGAHEGWTRDQREIFVEAASG